MCITCIYRDSTDATGCIAELASSVGDSTVTLNILRDDGTQCTALSSNATLSVYDWEIDGERSTRPAVWANIHIDIDPGNYFTHGLL